MNRDYLSEIKLNISRKTLGLKFKPFFESPLPPETVWKIIPPKLVSSDNRFKPWVYGVDGKWLKRQGVILVHRDVTNGENLYWSFHESESYQAYSEDLKNLSKLLGKDHLPVGAVSDWKGATISAVSTFFGDIPHQRCLVHVLREAKKLLPERSPFKATLSLRKIAKDLISIETEKEKLKWIESLDKWKERYGWMLNKKTKKDPLSEIKKKWWYTHGNLRRGFNLLTKDQNPFFVYLENPLIPFSNNSLEGLNSQLKKQLNNHRGMKLEQKISFVNWYFTFTRVKTTVDLRRLWDCWTALNNT